MTGCSLCQCAVTVKGNFIKVHAFLILLRFWVGNGNGRQQGFGIIRLFFPKGFNFRTVTDEDIQFAADLISNRLRKCLGWKNPAEDLAESVALV